MSEHRQLWLDAPARPCLAAGEVHVWRLSLTKDPTTVRALFELLAPDEQARAGKFHFQRDREHFVVARGMLRVILGRYLEMTPRHLEFTYNQYGKPALRHDAHPLRFNVSHSQGLALFAIASGREVGIDVEYLRADFAGLELAERFFSPSEVAALRALPPAARAHAFFNCWTRKEAYIKARGEGLSHPLHNFTVSVGSGESISLLTADNESREATRWSLIELFPAENYCAALAVEGGHPLVRCWQAL